MNLLPRPGTWISSCAGMLLTLVRHACASRQNKFAVHVLQQDRSLACHVREDSLDALGEKEGKEVEDAGKVYANQSAVGMFQLIFDESEHRRQIETDSSPSSGFSLRARGVHARSAAHLNKTFCYLFTQNGCLFEMIIRTCLS
jgi:hypothetical protein